MQQQRFRPDFVKDCILKIVKIMAHHRRVTPISDTSTIENRAASVDSSKPSRSKKEGTDSELSQSGYGKPQKGVYMIKGAMKVGIDPDVMYGIITDHESSPRIFKSISRVEIEEKENGKIVTQHARWNFFRWSGTFSIRLLVEEDHQSRSFKFQLQEPGFLRIFDGEWNVNPLKVEGEKAGSLVLLKQQMLPKVVALGPLSRCMCGVLSSQVRTLFHDLRDEANASNEGDKKKAAG
ncbi:hypothetical protein O6H91_Y185600 [Diphasiastrum complanatum]|nr:hypothetical protein O6H91_Y185600 [Diphasiastrum complanatum]